MALRHLITALFAWGIGSTAAAAPDLLSPEDEERYRKIFELQEAGKMSAADPLIEEVENQILLGYVFEQRYMHPTAYRSSYSELARWLSSYADHPDAPTIYRLAMRRRPSNARPQRPVARKWRQSVGVDLNPALEADYDSLSESRRRQVARIESRIRYLLAKDRPTQSLNYLNDPRQFNALSARQTDRIRGWIAESYYVNGRLDKAGPLARQAADRSAGSAVLAQWTAGLVAWRQGDMESAYRYHSAMAEEPHQQSSLRAAAAYWASRSALALGQADDAMLHLDLASSYPLTLYGQLALGQLGRGSGIDWSPIDRDEARLATLMDETPRLERAAALAEIGMQDEASLEVRYAHGELSPAWDDELLAFAGSLQLASAEVHLAEGLSIRETNDRDLWSALYPVPEHLEPTGGYTIDQAVLYGLIRQESKFMTHAKSRVGAAGLMQLMPRTASYITGDRQIMRRGTAASKKLYDPSYNMQLGQSYVETLLTRYNNGRGDMFEMALSYNWGPGNFSRWHARTGIDDQLLMLESVPNKEARHFVDLVMTNIWVYRDRLGEAAPSRDAAAAGNRPLYRSVR
ncbi:MAG: lytic transglycosylase domain-containing protein [Pseudomonadota bacterium]